MTSITFAATPVDSIPIIVNECHEAFNAHKNFSLEARLKNLRGFYNMVHENRDRIVDALFQGKHLNRKFIRFG